MQLVFWTRQLALDLNEFLERENSHDTAIQLDRIGR
jgi:hypothetical protein